jgi:hypothetical protein
MKNSIKFAAAALIGLSALTVSATSASAAVVCNGEGACWHVRGHPNYRREWGVVVHPDNWRWGPHDHFAWREHAGRGYWRNGVWVTF